MTFVDRNAGIEALQKLTSGLEGVFRRATIGRRPKDESKLSDATNTPRWLCDRLPIVDLDPCSNDRSNVRARWSYSLEKNLDGLKLPWRGSVFVNWPYGSPGPWAIKAMHELSIGRCTDAIVLLKLDGSTSSWDTITGWEPENIPGEPLCQPPDLWIFKDRIQFDEHPEIVAERAQKYAVDLDNFKSGRTKKKPTGRADGKSSNNFCSAIVHHRDARAPMLPLLDVATPWLRAI